MRTYELGAIDELVQQACMLLYGAVRAVFACHHVLK